jgi:Leucine-rich repeat (LRR) protein
VARSSSRHYEINNILTGELSSLRELYLQNCVFTEVPLMHSTASLPYLEKLDLSNNAISALTSEFFLFEHLSRLAISHNQFTSLPLELSNLRRLEYLDIR